ncbi:PilZ domain-containing protein [Sphingomonas faeni]|uniref:PilZ domain-containing protein n=1 Tax=Sphingomonas faeni TaxID=185950 RepID=UPI00334EBDE4
MFSADFEPVRITKRGAPRSLLGLDAELDGARRTLCRVSDISKSGARLKTYSALKVGSVIWLTLPFVGRVSATVKWADEYNSGCQFSEPLSDELLRALLVEAGRSPD